MFASIKGAPVEARTAVIVALVAFVVSIDATSVTTTNGVVTSCSRLDIAAVGLGAVAAGAGLFALIRLMRDRVAAQADVPVNSARWTLDPVSVVACLGMAAFGIAVGAYRILWGLNIIGSCP